MFLHDWKIVTVGFCMDAPAGPTCGKSCGGLRTFVGMDPTPVTSGRGTRQPDQRLFLASQS